MIIVRLQVDIETNGPNDDDLEPKTITMNGNSWKLPDEMFPRDIRLVAALEQMVREYNGRNK